MFIEIVFSTLNSRILPSAMDDRGQFRFLLLKSVWPSVGIFGCCKLGVGGCSCPLGCPPPSAMHGTAPAPDNDQVQVAPRWIPSLIARSTLQACFE